MKFDETMLSGYIDHELTAEERAVVERRLAESPQDRALLKTLSELHEKLSAMPQEVFQQDPVAGVRQRIATQQLQATANAAPFGKLAGSPANSETANIDAVDDRADSRASAKTTSSNNNHRSSSRWGRGVWIGPLAMAASLLAILASLQWREKATMALRDAPSGRGSEFEQQATRPNVRAAAIETEADESTEDASAPEASANENAPNQTFPAQDSAVAASSDAVPANSVPPANSAPKVMHRGTPRERALGERGDAGVMSFPVPREAAASAESEASNDSEASNAKLQLFSFAAQPAASTSFQQADTPFDEARSIGVEVPIGWTDDALRLIRDYLGSGANGGRQESDWQAAERQADEARVAESRSAETTDADSLAADGVEADLLAGGSLAKELSSGQSPAAVAVLVDASPEQLAGLIQAMRQWSRQVDRESTTDPQSNSAAMMIAGADSEDTATRSTVTRGPTNTKVEQLESEPTEPSLSANFPPRKSEQKNNEADAKETLQLGVEAGTGVREGRIWIVIRPAQAAP